MDELIQQARIVIQWFVFGPGAGALTYKAMEADIVKKRLRVVENFLSRVGLGKRQSKRIISFVMSWALSCLGYGIMLLAGWADPANAANTLVSLSGISTVTSQLVHSKDLDKREYQ